MLVVGSVCNLTFGLFRIVSWKRVFFAVKPESVDVYLQLPHQSCFAYLDSFIYVELYHTNTKRHYTTDPGSWWFLGGNWGNVTHTSIVWGWNKVCVLRCRLGWVVGHRIVEVRKEPLDWMLALFVDPPVSWTWTSTHGKQTCPIERSDMHSFEGPQESCWTWKWQVFHSSWYCWI